jgi:hypothetical protein
MKAAVIAPIVSGWFIDVAPRTVGLGQTEFVCVSWQQARTGSRSPAVQHHGH